MNLEKELVKLPKVVFPAVEGEIRSEKRFLCTHCKLVFSFEKDLISHLTVGVQVVKIEKFRESVSYTCKDCGMSFSSYFEGEEHYEKIHLNIRSFPCPTCGKLFRDRRRAKVHSWYMHSKSKRVECQVCSKVFLTKDSFKAHYIECLRKICENNKV